MDFINSYSAKNKQWDKFKVEVRLLKLTVLKIDIDISHKYIKIILFNLGVKI